MSDEFFFDDDVQETKKAKKSSGKKNDTKSSAKKSSGNKEATSAKKKSSAKVSDAKSQDKPVKKSVEPEDAGSFVVHTEEGTAVALSLVILIAIISILVGAIGGIFIGRSLAPQVVYDSTSTPSASDSMNSMMGGGTTGTGTDSTSGMPSGHPDISTMQDASGSGSGTTTSK